MHLAKISLSNFRIFKEKSISFSPQTNIIVGPNASGKTNILEGVYLLSTGKSFRAKVEEEMISYKEELARIGGSVANENESESNRANLEVVLTRGEISISKFPEKTSRVARKKLLINGLSKRLIDFAGTLRTVLFGPWDLDLVTESPTHRRKFMDAVLSQVDREYRRAVLSYEKGLRQRNRLLFRIREEGVSRSQLLFWNKLLIKNGDYISRKREELIEYANKSKPLNEQRFRLEYDKSAISEGRLEQYKDEEVAAATTLVGPHRDDFIFNVSSGKVQERDLARFGSRGEQRMGVLWLKLSELSFIEEASGDKPVLLLDDIFSELDHEHRDLVNKASVNQQTIITTADPHYLEGFKKAEKIDLTV